MKWLESLEVQVGLADAFEQLRQANIALEDACAEFDGGSTEVALEYLGDVPPALEQSIRAVRKIAATVGGGR